MIKKIEPVDPAALLTSFISSAKDDPRITTVHISLYASLIYCWREKQFENPLSVFSHELMPISKIAGPATYHRSIRELHAYGYIGYVPSFNHFLGSLVYIVPIVGTNVRDHKKLSMKYFLLPDQQHYRIMKVEPADIEAFRKKYRREIILEADRIAELLVQFSAKLEGMENQ